MLNPNQQPNLHTQPTTTRPLSQTHSHKNPTHLTIQQENHNNKNATKPQMAQNRNKQSVKGDDKKLRKMAKQTKKVKWLEEEYRELEEELREIKDLVQIQVEMIGCSFDEINQRVGGRVVIQNQQTPCTKKSNKFDNANNPGTSQSTFSLNSQPVICGQTITPLQNCLSHLFTHHSTIQTANSNYLLLSQVNKQQESQQIFHIHNLEERVRQLRFLLNGKQDLLAYEMATLNHGYLGQEAADVGKISVQYLLPKKDSLGMRENMDGEFRFVEKIVGDMEKLKKCVKELEIQLGRANMDENENQEANYSHEKDSIKQNYQQNTHQGNCERLVATPTKRTHTRQSQPQILNQCQNNFRSAKTTCPPKESAKSSPDPKTLHIQRQLTLLPLSIQNYKHSLIYRVGTLQEVQQQQTRKLKEKYENLMAQLRDQQTIKKKLVKEYELKKDVFQFKSREVAATHHRNSGSIQPGNTLGNILTALDEQSQPLVAILNGCKKDDLTRQAYQNALDFNQQSMAHAIQQLPIQTQRSQIKSIPSSKLHSIIDLNSSQSQTNHSKPLCYDYSKPLSSDQNPIFHQLTNSQSTPNKKIHKSPFLKLKSSQQKPKNLIHHHDFSDNTPVKKKILDKYGDKENTPQKPEIDGQLAINVCLQNEKQDFQVSHQKVEKQQKRALSTNKNQDKNQVKKAKLTLRRRRQNAKINNKDKGFNQQVIIRAEYD